MKLFGCINVGLACFFEGMKVSHKMLATVCADAGSPHAIEFVPAYSAKSTASIFLDTAISVILGVVREANVGYSVIRSVAIDMVDLLWRPMAVNPHPSYAVRQKFDFVNGDDQVAIWAHRAALGSSVSAIPVWASPRFPSEDASLSIVIQKRPDLFLSEGIFSRFWHGLVRSVDTQKYTDYSLSLQGVC